MNEIARMKIALYFPNAGYLVDLDNYAENIDKARSFDSTVAALTFLYENELTEPGVSVHIKINSSEPIKIAVNV